MSTNSGATPKATMGEAPAGYSDVALQRIEDHARGDLRQYGEPDIDKELWKFRVVQELKLRLRLIAALWEAKKIVSEADTVAKELNRYDVHDPPHPGKLRIIDWRDRLWGVDSAGS